MSADSTTIPSTPGGVTPLPSPAPLHPSTSTGHIRLTSHAGGFGALPIHWGAATAAERGPVVGTTTKRGHRNVIGTHSGSYSVYRALAVAAGALDARAQGRPHQHRAHRRDRPVSAVVRAGDDRLARPVGRAGRRRVRRRTRGRLRHPPDHRRHQGARDPARDRSRRSQPAGSSADGQVLPPSGAALVTKAAIEPVWYLPGVAQRFGCSETDLRRALFEETGGMYPELVTRSRPRGVPAADRRADRLHLRRRRAIWPTRASS